MPSGSHFGGGGGSHSSGGSSRGSSGGSWGGSSRGGGHHHRRPIRFGWGHRRYYVSVHASSKISSLFAFGFALLFFGIVFMFVRTTFQPAIDKIITDRIYYLEMIDYAEKNPEYLVEGEVTDKFYNEGAKKWYVEYRILLSNAIPDKYGRYDDFDYLDGYTYSIYTFEEVSKFHVGDTILLAVNSSEIKSTTDSVNIDYKDFPIEKDGEYAEIIKQKNGFAIASVGAMVVGGVLIILAIVQIFKNAQKEGEGDPEYTGTSTNTSTANTSTIKRCPYCGEKTTSDKCNNCGASF